MKEKQSYNQMSFISSPLPCFRPSKTTDDHHPPPSRPLSGNPNLTTYIYQTDAGTVSLTWSRSILGCTLHLLHHHHPFDSSSSFSLHIKPFTFWNKHGSRKLSDNTHLFWNLSKARFGSGPEPQSKFYVALVVDHELILLIGDIDARARCRARDPKNPQTLLLKREHVDIDIDARDHRGAYRTRAAIAGKSREISIEIEIGFEGESYQHKNNSRVLFLVDGESVLEVNRLKWKFRGNERVEVDGVPVQISWDVHDWLFDDDGNGNGDGRAVFMFKFEENNEVRGEQNLWSNWKLGSCDELGKTGSSSSLSMSSSFGGSSSVMEWSSVEENELVVPLGFSLLVYAWKR